MRSVLIRLPVLLTIASAAAPVQAQNPWDMYWADTGWTADWGGRDQASTSTEMPRYSVHDNVLCDAAHIGYIATCWTNRPNGYPGVPVTDTDIVGTPPAWCTYKNGTIKINTPPDGAAPPGKVYICARAVPHP
jgi:hypothetical protein